MNDPQLTDLFREQLRDETSTAPAFEELWSKAAAQHRSSRVRKFAAIAIALGCVSAAVFALVAREKEPTRVEQRVAAVPVRQSGEPTAEIKASASPEPYRLQSESATDRLSEINSHILYLRSRNEADKKRATVLKALNQTDEASRINEQIATRNAEIAAQTETAEKLAKTVEASPVAEVVDAILPGDNVGISVNEDPDFNGRYVVRRGGYIIMPRIGKVPIAGKSVSQAATDIHANLMQFQAGRTFTVEVKRHPGSPEATGTVVYLAGEFRNPRPYRIPENTSPSLIATMLSSGGWTDRADLTKVKIMRMAKNKPTAEVVDVKKVLEGPIPNPNIANMPTLTEGDVIVLPASNNPQLVYVTGAVKRPGSYRVSEGEKLNVTGAIHQTGGFEPGFGTPRVYILRKAPDGSDLKIPVNLEGIKQGKTPDVQLVSGDIVMVDQLK